MNVTPNPFQQWIADSFTPLERATPSLESTVWGDGANLDRDIFSNIIEFFHGLDVHSPDFVPQVVQGTSGPKATYSFLKRKDTGGVDFSVEVSANRTGPFSSLPASNIVTTSIDSEFDMVTATDTLRVSTTTPRFGKLTLRNSVTSGPKFESETLGTVCIDIAANSGSTIGNFSFFSLGTIQQKVFEGTIGAIAPNTLTDSNADWSNADFTTEPHFVVITAPGPNEGRTSTISSHSADTLTLVDDLSSLNPAPSTGDTYEIRPHNTIERIFGENNAAGFQEGPNGTAGDNVMILEPAGPLQRYFFSSFASVPGWRDVSFAPAGNTVLLDEQGIIVARKASTQLSIYPQGAIRTINWIAPIEEGFSLVGPMRTSSPIPIAQLGLVAPDGNPNLGLAPGLNANLADNILVPNASGSLTRYFHNGVEWLDVTFRAAGGVHIPHGSSFFVHRKPRPGFPASFNAFNWTIPKE